MTASLHKLTAGDGYTYLTRQVAVSDATDRGRSTLSDYYSEKGERPGRWFGGGVAGLGSVQVGGLVSEAQMRALFGEGRHPDADVIQQQQLSAGRGVQAALRASQLGRAYPAMTGRPSAFLVETQRRYQHYNAERGHRVNAAVPEEVRSEIRSEVGRATFVDEHGRAPADGQELTAHVTRASRRPPQVVAGFDVTFTPVKSVSALWAVAPRAVAEQVETAHDEAVAHALGWLEREVAHTRRGAGGVRQTEVTGLVATTFTHRDSRNGDPNLHTHVAIANKVQARSDGAWLALDGAALYRALVTVSEHYNTHLEALLGERLGVGFADGQTRDQRRPIREIVGMPDTLLQAWSSRRTQIEQESERLARDFQAAHGRAPTAVERIALAQQANLSTRQDKHEPRSLAEQREQWREQAAEVLGSTGAVDDAVTHALPSAHHVGDDDRGPHPDDGRRRADLLSSKQVRAVAEQVVRVVSKSRARWQPTHVMAEALRQLRGAGMAEAAIDRAVDLVVREVVEGAVPLTKADEVAVPDQLRRSDGTSVYEPKHTRLYTTQAVVDAEARIVDLALRRGGRTVGDAAVGLALLEAEANGRGLNPGQAELVRALGQSGRRVQLAVAPAGSGKTTAMQTLARAWTEDGGNVIGLAPSAVAADELRAAVPGGTVDTLAQLAFALDPPAAPAGAGSDQVSGADARAAGEFEERRLRLPVWAEAIDADTLVLVDEAGMAATTELASVVEFVCARGGSVRLVGDDRQLAAVGAGGVLRDVADAAGLVTLTELMRFDDDAEAAASLAVRDGDAAAVGFYLDRGRLHDAADPVDALVQAWAGDVERDLSVLMVAGRRESVTTLNERARAHRVALGQVDGDGPRAVLRSGLPASAGDEVLTRCNDRRNRLSTTDFVKNGDRWRVVEVAATGAVQVQHQRSGKLTWLSRDYVAAHVDHGYAVTVHSAQGSTVDVSHVLLEGGEDRQGLYVALSRGRSSNHVWLSTSGDGDPHNVVRPEVRRPSTAAEVVAGVLARDGRQASAATTLRDEAAPAQRLAHHTAAYLDGVTAAVEDLAGTDVLADVERAAEDAAPGVSGAGGWPRLRTVLALEAVAGRDPAARLRAAIAARPLDDAADVAAVLAARLEGGAPADAGPLPWLSAVPAAVAAHPTWGAYLDARAAQVRRYAHTVAEVTTTALEPPRWAAGIADVTLRRDLAVWRAARAIPDTDLAPAGQRLDASPARHHQAVLEQRVELLAGPPVPVSEAVLRRLRDVEPDVLRDPFWPVVARRLAAAQAAGHDVDQLVDDALAQPWPLPAEQTAAALWFRLAGQLHLVAPDPDADTRLRPGWTDDLLARLPSRLGNRLLGDPQWPDLVAAVADAEHRTGLPAARLLERAVGLLDLAAPAEGGIADDAAAALLIWRLTDLAGPAPDPDDEPPHPDDSEQDRPDDLDAIWAASQVEQGDQGDRTGERPRAADLANPEVAGPEVDDAELDRAEAGGRSAGDVGSAESGRDIGADSARDAEAHAFVEVVEGPRVPRDRIVALNNAAADWWGGAYPASLAASYIRGRLGTDLLDDQRVTIGYAAAGWTRLVDHLRNVAGADDVELVDAGLARWSRRGTLVDLMRDRVMFGIRDEHGDLVGFTGRATAGEVSSPKWINTPNTAAFVKGELLFGLAENRDLLAAGATPVRVEGVLDALAVRLATNGRAVGLAPLGTSLTAAQAATLARWADGRPVLHGTDNDPAGRKAAARDHALLAGRGVDLRRLVLTGPDPLNDPAEAFAAAPAALGAALDAPDIAPPLAGYVAAVVIDSHRDLLRAGHLHGLVGVARQVAPIVAVAPEAYRDSLLDDVAALLADTAGAHPTLARELLTSSTADVTGSRTDHEPAHDDGSTPLLPASAGPRTSGDDSVAARAQARIAELVARRAAAGVVDRDASGGARDDAIRADVARRRAEDAASQPGRGDHGRER